MSPERRRNIDRLAGVKLGLRGDYQTWVFAAAGICLLLIATYSVFNVVETILEENEGEAPERVERVSLPDFASIASTKERKEAFFSFLEPFVIEANNEILEERAEILELQAYFERRERLNAKRLERFNALREVYELDPVEAATASAFKQLLNRADTIPVSLALAQAAIESGWGTSRFARQGNNLFGMWCYEPGCGIVPKRRPAGRSYEVAAYDNPEQSFLAYVRNLNTNAAYAAMREIRAAQREGGLVPSGHELAGGLVRYSQERWEYVRKVRGMISSNRLHRR